MSVYYKDEAKIKDYIMFLYCVCKGESAHEDRDLDSLGGRSGSVDSITSGGSAVDDNSWQKRPSMFMTSGDDSYSDDVSKLRHLNLIIFFMLSHVCNY